jgi:putative hemolysin
MRFLIPLFLAAITSTATRSILAHPTQSDNQNQRRATTCNGHAELCDKSYGNVTFLGTHNSYAVGGEVADNQGWNVTRQLVSRGSSGELRAEREYVEQSEILSSAARRFPSGARISAFPSAARVLRRRQRVRRTLHRAQRASVHCAAGIESDRTLSEAVVGRSSAARISALRHRLPVRRTAYVSECGVAAREYCFCLRRGRRRTAEMRSSKAIHIRAERLSCATSDEYRKLFRGRRKLAGHSVE